MRKFITNVCFIVGIVISAVLENRFAQYDKNYVTLALSAAYFLYWAAEFIYAFVMFRKTYPERYKLFVVETINKKKLSKEIIEAEEKKYKKKFKRSLFKERAIYYLEIALALGGAIALIVAMCI